jgi:hypothetical protein
VGNQATCNFQGFLLQLAIGAPLYNCSLALCYLLTIMYDWSNDRLALMGRWVHMFIISFSVGTSILLLPLGQYNQITQVCWIIGYPSGCGNSSNIRSNIPCVRGNWSWNYGILLFYGPLWLCIVLTIIAMANIYLVVRATHTRMQRYSTQALNAMESNGTKIGNTTSEDRKSSGFVQQGRHADAIMVAHQAILYSLSFFITWMPSTAWSLAHWFNVSSFWLDFSSAFCEPLQGFWNCIVFVQHRPSSRNRIRVFLRQTFERFTSNPDSSSSMTPAAPIRFT